MTVICPHESVELGKKDLAVDRLWRRAAREHLGTIVSANKILTRPLINKLPPPNRDYNRNPNIKALKRWGFISQGSSLLAVSHGSQH